MGITGISTQLMLGKTEAETFRCEEIEERLSNAADLVDIRRLFFWNAGAEENWETVSRICDKLDIELYCWFPVLADTIADPVGAGEAVKTITGESGYGPSGRWEKILSGEENFLFSCPRNGDAVGRNFRKYKEILQRWDFEGVFLDRIRYPSFANGLEAVFSCLCPDCGEKISASSKDSISNLRRMYGFLKKADAAELNKVESWKGLYGRFDLDDFLEFRYKAIDEAAGRFADHAKSIGLDVGLDLLTASLGPVVGQDYSRLHRHASWLKMMTYCYANGPAGVPLEAASLARGLMELNETGLTQAEALKFAGRMFDLDLEGFSVERLLADGVCPAYLKHEVDIARTLLPGAENKIIPGIELVSHPFFTPPISRDKCLGYLDVLSGMTTEIIACWNILYIPGEYLNMINERIN